MIQKVIVENQYLSTPEYLISAGVITRIESLPVLTLLVRAGEDGQVHAAGGGTI
jgi:hypothetical protein